MRPAEGELLRECLRSEPRPRRLEDLLPRCSPVRLVSALKAHRVACTVAPVLTAAERHGAGSVPPGVLDYVRARRVQMATHWLRMQVDLDQLRSVLAPARARWVVVKGPVVAETLYGSVGLREWNDLDLLLDRRGFGRALDLLETSGARLIDRNWSMVRERMQGEMSLELPHGTALDLHWHLLNGGEKRRVFDVDVDALLARSGTIGVNGHDIPCLDPVDQLLHVCLHACLSGGHRLQWVKDVERAAAVVEDWEAVVVRAHEWRTGLPTALMLDRARRVLAADVPRSVVRRLAPGSPWRAAAVVAGIARPAQHSHVGPHSGGLLMLRARTGTRASWSALRRSRPSPEQVGGCNPLHQPGGTQQDRVDYLALLAGPVEP